jgi:hypothetical protein
VSLGERIHLDVDAAGWRLFEADGEAVAPIRPGATTASEPQLPSFGG